MSSNKNILITGANRGIGYGLLEAFVPRPNHTLIAAVRNPFAAKSQALLALPTGTGSQVLLVEIDSSSQTDAATAVKQLQSEHNITHLDLVIANSAVLPLLKKSKNPKFVTMGSAMGSTGGMEQRPYPMAAYGASKAILHNFTRQAHFQNESLTAFVADPVFTQTDIGNNGAKAVGLEKAFTTLEDCTNGLLSQIDGATREKTSGHIVAWNDEEFPW